MRFASRNRFQERPATKPRRLPGWASVGVVCSLHPDEQGQSLSVSRCLAQRRCPFRSLLQQCRAMQWVEGLAGRDSKIWTTLIPRARNTMPMVALFANSVVCAPAHRRPAALSLSLAVL